MTSFKGIKCPICNVPFSDADDIVVCPECGAPYHRACYKQIGHCIYNHEAGESWQAPAEEKPAGDSIRCPHCGAENPPKSLFCNTCGSPLNNPAGNGVPGQNAAPNQNPNFNAAYSSFFSNVSGLHPEELVADDVTVDEASKAVQMNSLYYVPIFKTLRERNHGRFNFAALMFSAGWLLYRKMYKLGGILLGVQTALQAMATYISVFKIEPIMVEIYTKLGIDPAVAVLSHEQQLLISSELGSYPQLAVLSLLTYLPMIAMLVISLVLGFCGNRIYYKHVLGKIRKTRESFSGQTPAEYEGELLREGGVNPKVILIIAVINMLIMYLPYFLL